VYYQTSDQERIQLGFAGHECNNGTHFCGLYETADERDEIILGYLRQGLVDRARVLYTPTERNSADFALKFLASFPGQARLIEGNPDFTINTARDLYYQGGSFSPFQMNVNLNRFYERGRNHAGQSVRTTAEMVWALDLGLDKAELMAYESRLNYFIPGKAWISICMYNLTRFSGKTIMNVLQTHPYTICKGGSITRNPYYVHPDDWLAKNAPHYAH
jgi:hypothetical protein